MSDKFELILFLISFFKGKLEYFLKFVSLIICFVFLIVFIYSENMIWEVIFNFLEM